MWAGQKDKEKERLVYQRALPNNKIKGFTLVELIVISFILGIIISALATVLNISNLSNTIGMTKANTQAEARNIMSWISKDARQTSGYQITNNAPSFDHIKFQLCAGHNGTDLLWNSTFIEYTYEASSNTITRNNTETGQTWQFYNVTASPFNTTRLNENILGITISIQKTARGLIQPAVNLTREVKLRNG